MEVLKFDFYERLKQDYLRHNTANEGSDLEKALEDLKSRNIPFDLVNENPIKKTRKPYYNILLDDRAGLIESYNYLKKITDEIRNQEI